MNTRTHRGRRGFSYLEVQTAFAILGIALAGLAPIVVVQLRLVKKIENRLDPSVTHYLVPPADTWARKLGAAATSTTTAPTTTLPETPPDPSYTVSIISFVSSANDDTALAVATVTGIPSGSGGGTP